ncbi:MAG TPA: GNAT family N-acetyltransferase [bacterium]|nr:GNAT family N-acetyltransferase [bacterium]
METQILEWDSSFFGFKVGRVLAPRLDALGLRQALEGLASQSVAMVYWSCDPKDGPSREAALGLGGLKVDEKRLYRRNLAGAGRDVPAGVEPYGLREPDADLLRLAVLSGGHSRFRVDPRFPRERFVALYERWMRASLTGEMAETVWVARRQGALAGMVTLGRQKAEAFIGLIAVDPSYPRQGVGGDLVKAGLAWALEKGCATSRVVTQGGNLPACRLYEKAGYQVDQVEDVYHFWLRDP